jgi:PAS domain S-box-containing protein
MPEKPPPTILIVDDIEASRYAVSHILRKARFVVREAGTGQDALRLAAEKPDLIILDVNLPDMSGFEVCQKIKADPATAATPVLHLSASFVHSDARAEGLESGADGYLTYPLEPRELIANVQALLRVREAEKAARAQRELLHVTLSSIGDGVVATDAGGTVTFINPVAQGLTGWSEADAVGRPLDDIFRIVHEKTGQPIENPAAQVIRTGRAAGLANHSVLIGRDGTRRPIDDTAAPIRDHERQFVGVVLVFRDIAERKRLEDALRQRSEALADRDRRKDEFLAMLAHELRNPLAPIRNSLQVLRLKLASDPEADHAGEMMERQVKHLARLIDDLLDVSRVTQGKLELQVKSVDLGAVVNRTVEAVRPLMDERRHRLEVVLPDSQLCLRADPGRLEQVLSNLLNNAAKYTDTGGHIRLEAVREGAEAIVRVRDNGIGIRTEMLPRLFDIFQQADRVPGRVSEGLGLGLSLVRSLVEMHGGRVTASSAGPALGSEFVVRLPALPAGAEADPPAREIPGASTSSRSLRVLITDDNRDAAESMAMVLRFSGHEVRTAHDGPAALEVAKSFRPHAIFLDIGLPKGMDGYEVARRLRKQPDAKPALLVAMTGYGQQEDRERSRLAGFDHHLVKPADLMEVDRLLREKANAAYGSHDGVIDENQ